MSHFLDRLTYFKKYAGTFANGHGEVTTESRAWEDAYRSRWAHDKIVRSTHGANCTGSCSWKIYVKGGIVTWETQQTDYPRTRPGLPNHEPRGCSRGASYSWYLYSANRIKYPMMRKRLVALWGAAKAQHGDPAYARIDAPADREQKAKLAALSPDDVQATSLAGEPITGKLTEAPGNGAKIGGLKVTTESAWFAARPSGTEDVYKIYAESFRGPDHLSEVQAEAREVVGSALG